MTEIDIEQENKAIAKQYKELLKISYRILSKKIKNSYALPLMLL